MKKIFWILGLGLLVSCAQQQKQEAVEVGRERGNDPFKGVLDSVADKDAEVIYEWENTDSGAVKRVHIRYTDENGKDTVIVRESYIE